MKVRKARGMTKDGATLSHQNFEISSKTDVKTVTTYTSSSQKFNNSDKTISEHKKVKQLLCSMLFLLRPHPFPPSLHLLKFFSSVYAPLYPKNESVQERD